MPHPSPGDTLIRWLTRHWGHICGVAGLLVLTYLAYRPSLDHTPRSDQWGFLLETADHDSFWPLLTQTYSYNRTRRVLPGDYPLFRPVLFALLSAEKALFGHRFVWWQAVGIVLHLVVVCLFLAILLRIQRLHAGGHKTGKGAPKVNQVLLQAVAYSLAYFFALNFAGAEMVIWSHINGYLLFLAFALGSMLLVLDFLADPARGGRIQALRVAGAVMLSLLAAFTYEIGQFYAVAIGLVLGLSAFRRGRPRQAILLFALFCSSLVLYQVADRLDRRAHPYTQPDVDLSNVLTSARWDNTIANVQRYVLYATVQPFFPSCAAWKLDRGRLNIAEPGNVRGHFWRWDTLLVVSYLVALALLILTVVSLGSLMTNRLPGVTLLIGVLPAALFLLHLGVTVFGRINLRDIPGILSRNSYYAYLPLLALLIGLYNLWAAALFRGPLGETGRPMQRRATLIAHAILLAGLGVLTAASGWKVHTIAVTIKNAARPFRVCHTQLLDFIDRHQGEPGFGFSFDPACFHSLETYRGVPFPLIFFQPYIDHTNPTHVVVQDGRKLTALTAEEYDCREPGRRSLPLPYLASAGTPYTVFRYEGAYYGVLHWDGPYRPDRTDHFYLIQGATLEEVLHQVPAKLAEQATDIRSGRFQPRLARRQSRRNSTR